MKKYLISNGYNSEPTNDEAENENEEKENEEEEQMNNAEKKVHFPNSPALMNINNVLSSSLIRKYSEKFLNAVFPNRNTTNNEYQENDHNDDENEETTIQEANRNKSIKPHKVPTIKDFDANSLNEEGETALHVAFRNNRKEGVEFLIDKGADDNIFSKE